MKIPYNRTRLFFTSELPGVLCDPPLQFEFAASPSFEVLMDISKWLKNPQWEETKRLAAILIVGVVVPDGTRHELGTPELIEELAAETDRAFIGNLINGWNTRISLERITELKKNRVMSEHFTETNSAKIQA